MLPGAKSISKVQGPESGEPSIFCTAASTASIAASVSFTFASAAASVSFRCRPPTPAAGGGSGGVLLFLPLSLFPLIVDQPLLLLPPPLFGFLPSL